MIGRPSAFKRLETSHIKVEQTRIEEKLGEQFFHYDASDLLELITESLEKTSEEKLGNFTLQQKQLKMLRKIIV